MSPQRVPHSKKVWFDELYLSWVQLGEIIAAWWEIRAVPCCAVLGESTAVKALKIQLTRGVFKANSAAHTSVTEQAKTKQDTLHGHCDEY